MCIRHIIIQAREALKVCPFNEDGQFQGLKEWDGQEVWLMRIFIHIQKPKSEPGGNYNLMKHSDIEMFLMTNKEYLPEDKLPFIKSKLEKMEEEKLDNIALISFKSPTTMLLISIFLGSLGIDRFMLGDTGMGIGKLLTWGGCGIWWLIDVCIISKATKEKNFAKLSMCL